MSLFGKLKSRLLKTSSKLDAGLDAIVQDTSADDASALAPDAGLSPEQDAPKVEQSSPAEPAIVDTPNDISTPVSEPDVETSNT